MRTWRQPSTALVIVALVALFGVALVFAAGGDERIGFGLDYWWRVEGVALLFAFAAWPLLAARAAKRVAVGEQAGRMRR